MHLYGQIKLITAYFFRFIKLTGKIFPGKNYSLYILVWHDAMPQTLDLSPELLNLLYFSLVVHCIVVVI